MADKQKNEHRKLLDLGFTIFGAGWPFTIIAILRGLIWGNWNIPELYGGLSSIAIGLLVIFITMKHMTSFKKHLYDIGLALFAPAAPLFIIEAIKNERELITLLVSFLALIGGVVLENLAEKREKPT